jgi:DNA-binding NarL/FixJ family response regulator
MRVLLVGSPAGRARLRAGFGPSTEILGEYGSLSEARGAGIEADAIVLASAARSERPSFDEPLTAREIQVLELLAEGLPNKSIAARLGISDQTVKFHVSAIYGKLGAANRTDAVRKAVGRGLVTL